MKKLAIMAVCLAASFGACAQGLFSFSNHAAAIPPNPAVDAPIFDASGNKLTGTAYLAQMYAGPSATELFAQGVPVPFRTGTGAGYWVTSTATAIALTGGDAAWRTAGATAFVQVRAWAAALGTTYEAAVAANLGQVGELQTALQIASGGSGSPPSVPANLYGMSSFSLSAVPEPSTIALGLLGAAILVLRRRK